MKLDNFTDLDNCTGQSQLDHRYWPNTCFRDEFSHLRLTMLSSATENFISRYVFPVQLVVGVIGNTLNLICFNSKGMRTKTNLFLSFMAMADLFFLLCTFPTKLVSYDVFNGSKNYVQFFYRSHPTFIALVNWFSAASIWLTVGVTTERVVAVKFPLHARFLLNKRRLTVSIVVIYIVALVISVFHIVLRKVVTGPICGQCDQVTYRWEPPTIATGMVRYYYVMVSVGLYSLLVIFLPLIVIIVLNSILIHYLRQHRLTADNVDGGDNQQTNVIKQKSTERKVTVMVVVIIVSFLTLNLPSAIIYIIETVRGITRSRTGTVYANIICVSNAMVTTGKATNFILFCLSSESFRKRLGDLIMSQRASAMRRFSRISEANGQNSSKRRSTPRTPLSPAMRNLLGESRGSTDNSTDGKLPFQAEEDCL